MYGGTGSNELNENNIAHSHKKVGLSKFGLPIPRPKTGADAPENLILSNGRCSFKL